MELLTVNMFKLKLTYFEIKIVHVVEHVYYINLIKLYIFNMLSSPSLTDFPHLLPKLWMPLLIRKTACLLIKVLLHSTKMENHYPLV